jgi:uncharacterized ubiquitin-like protein YukD
MKNNLSLVLFFILNFSCSEKNGEIKEFNLVGQTLHLTELINPDHIRIKNNFIVVLESPSMDAFNPPIHIINRKTKDLLYSTGQIGFGPNEISDATSVEFSKNDSIFYIYSSIDKKISEFSFSYSATPNYQIKQKNDFFKAYKVLKYTDSTYLGLTVDSPSRFVEFNKEGQSISFIGKNENFSDRQDLDNFNIAQINMGWFGSNPSRTHFAVASIFTNRIEIFDVEKNSVNTFYLDPKDHTKFDLVAEPSGYSVHWDLKSPYHFRDVVLSNEYIFALYGGYSEREIQSNSIIAQTVYVFSLTGKLQAKLNLDTSIRSLAIDEELKELYGITTNSEPGIIKFELPKAINE